MKDQSSAFVDGELGDAESARLIAQLKGDPALRHAWDEYHRIGDALRGHVAPVLGARLAERLAAEPVVLAPAAMRGASPVQQVMTRWALPAAAAVAAVALVAWTALPTFFSGAPQVAQTAAPATVAQSAPATPPLAAGPQVASTQQGAATPVARNDAALS